MTSLACHVMENDFSQDVMENPFLSGCRGQLILQDVVEKVAVGLGAVAPEGGQGPGDRSEVEDARRPSELEQSVHQAARGEQGAGDRLLLRKPHSGWGDQGQVR